MPTVNQSTASASGYAAMSQRQLEGEYAFWEAELASAERWGASIAAADEARQAVEAELRRRRVAELRAEQGGFRPFIVDDPGVRLESLPVIRGTAAARAEWKPSVGALLIIGVLSFLCLAVAVASSGQRLAHLERQYRQEARL